MYPSGVGTDIIEIGRIEKAIEKYQQRFLDKFLPKRTKILSKVSHIRKAFCWSLCRQRSHRRSFWAPGFKDGISWLDIEVTNDQTGKPTVNLSEHLKKTLNFPEILLSISHCHEYATACAIYIQKQK